MTTQSLGSDASRSGGCLCGAVRYEIRTRLRPVVNCHCEQCRRTSGHFVAATEAALDDLTFTEDRGLRWYRSSPFARRGFCGDCGSSLFWQRDEGEGTSTHMSIMAGTLDQPTGLETAGNIYAAYAGDYYRVDDSLPTWSADGELFPKSNERRGPE